MIYILQCLLYIRFYITLFGNYFTFKTGILLSIIVIIGIYRLPLQYWFTFRWLMWLDLLRALSKLTSSDSFFSDFSIVKSSRKLCNRILKKMQFTIIHNIVLVIVLSANTTVRIHCYIITYINAYVILSNIFYQINIINKIFKI